MVYHFNHFRSLHVKHVLSVYHYSHFLHTSLYYYICSDLPQPHKAPPTYIQQSIERAKNYNFIISGNSFQFQKLIFTTLCSVAVICVWGINRYFSVPNMDSLEWTHGKHLNIYKFGTIIVNQNNTSSRNM